MKWDRDMLDAALDEALRDGAAVRAPEADSPADARALRQALYNRAGRRKLEGLEFSLQGAHVVVKRKERKTVRRVEE